MAYWIQDFAKYHDEEKEMEELYKQLGIEDLPENTQDTEARTEVKPLEGWYSTTPAYVSTEDGSIVKKEVKVASVTAIATGNEETVPVPKGFYYVGGTRSTGVVISDKQEDQNKYVNYTPIGEVKEGLPTGVTYNEDGTVKTYTEEEYKKHPKNEQNNILIGNQFVWIPCSESEYVKKDFTGKSNATWERQTNTAELPQI